MTGTETLVLGATGTIGRRVAERLAARGRRVRAAGRSSAPRFDWDDPDTWPAALRGAGAVFVLHPELALPGAAATVTALAALAQRSGVGRLVLLSRRGEDGAAMCEQGLRESGVEWTIVRSSWLSQDFSEGRHRDPVASGVVALPALPVGEPFVDARDVAEVAAEALTGAGHGGRVYEVTGPRLLTFAEAIEEIGDASGRVIRFERVSMQEYAARLAQRDVSMVDVSLLRYLFSEVLDGRNAWLADGVRRVLGREPRDFADFAREAAATGVWNDGKVQL
jgi:uncharacterized protein YbjT (DUF2867 family)